MENKFINLALNVLRTSEMNLKYKFYFSKILKDFIAFSDHRYSKIWFIHVLLPLEHREAWVLSGWWRGRSRSKMWSGKPCWTGPRCTQRWRILSRSLAHSNSYVASRSTGRRWCRWNLSATNSSLISEIFCLHWWWGWHDGSWWMVEDRLMEEKMVLVTWAGSRK